MDHIKDTSVFPKQIPLGLHLLYTLHGHSKTIIDLAWSPDGSTLASASMDGTICLWDLQSSSIRETLKRHVKVVNSIAWSPNGRLLASASQDHSIRIWNIQKHGQLLHDHKREVNNITQRHGQLLHGHKGPVNSIAWSPNGRLLASASRDRTICLWNIQTGRLLQTLKLSIGPVISIEWSPDGLTLASTSDRDINLWHAESGKWLKRLAGHGGHVTCVTWSPDGQTLASASQDHSIRVWNSETGVTEVVLEAHTSSVDYIRFSYNGELLASKGRDSCLRLWRCDTWDQVAIINESTVGSFGGLAFHPRNPQLATLSANDNIIYVWQLNYDVLLSTAAPSDTCHYRNAKVVLIGDTGVGKTGLGLVLTGQPWQPTASTHGRHIWSFESDDVALPDGRQETRETLLWDLAGQPGYRLIHQLHLNEAAVALVVFDARSETEPFAGVRYWHRALRQAQRLQGDAATPLKKFLVAARADRGGIAASRARIDTTVRDLSFDGFFETSAKEDWQISEVRAAIRDAIAWDVLPMVSSNELFQTIKAFLVAEKKAGRLVSTAEELYRSLCHTYPDLIKDTDLHSKFETCMGRVENRGLIRRLHFGGYVLLQPEKLDAYASAMVNAAKSEPDGLGFLAEEEALMGRFVMPKDERVPNRDQEKLLLIATVEELMQHEIVIKEISDGGADLVFPSQFTRERPDAPDVPGKAVVFAFEGPVLNIYATLAVRIAHSQFFVKQEMWKDTANYRATVGGLCGISLRELDEGQGEITLFYDADTSEVVRYQFEDYVAAHLQRRAVIDSIRRRRIIVCAECGIVISDEMAKLRRARGFTEMQCPVCGITISLLDREERIATASAARTGEIITAMDRAADAKRNYNTATMIIQGKIASKDYDVFLCHNSKDKSTVKAIGERLKEEGILPWLDEWELRPGLPWQPELEQHISAIKAAAVFVGPEGLGPWQDMEQQAFLRQFVQRRCPVIPVILPKCKKVPPLPVFLAGMTWIDFRKRKPSPLQQLVWGITGERRE